MTRAKRKTTTVEPLDQHDQPDGIPLAKDGYPIFFVLPPGVQATYERWMATCRAGWGETGDPAFVIEAQAYIATHRQPPPLWLTKAICEVLTKKRAQKGFATRALNAAIRRTRHATVLAARRSGLTWKEAYRRATGNLAGTAARGTAATMKAAYDRVQGDFKSGHFGLYIAPKMPQVNVGDALRRKP